MEGPSGHLVSLLDSIATSPTRTQISFVTDALRRELFSCKADRLSLAQMIFEVIRKASLHTDHQLVTCYADLLFEIHEIQSSNIWLSSMNEAVKMASMDMLFQNSEPSPEILCRQLNFVDEILQRNLVGNDVLLSYAHVFLKSDDASSYVPYIFELLRKVDFLVDERAVVFSSRDWDMWNCYTCYLAGITNTAIEMDPECGQDLAEIAQYLEQRGQRYGHSHGSSCRKQPSLFIVDQELEETQSQPLEDGRTISEPAWENYPAYEQSEEAPKPLDRQSVREANVEGLLSSLRANLECFPLVLAEVRGRLLCCNASREFIDIVCLLLDEMSKVHPVPNIWLKLVRALRSVGIKPAGRKGPCTVFNAVHAWSQRTFNRFFRTVEDVKAASKSLRLQAELCKLGMLSFKMLIDFGRRLRNIDPTHLYFLYKLMKNVDELVDSGCWVMDKELSSAWFGRHCFLRDAVNRGQGGEFFPEKKQKVLQFLQSVEEKGGWSRTSSQTSSCSSQLSTCSPPMMVRSQSSVAAECDSTSTADHLHRPQSLPIMTEHQQAITVTTKLEINSPIHPHSPSGFQPHTPTLPEVKSVPFLQRDDSVEAAVADFKDRLISQPPFRFSSNVTALLDMLLSQIGHSISLDYAAQLCVDLGPVTNIRGDNFALHMQEYFLKLFRQFENTCADSRLKAWTNDPELNTILDDMSAQTELNFEKKYVTCAKLVGRLYSLEMLPFSFLMTFIETVVRTKNEGLYLGLLEMLEFMSSFAVDLEWQAIPNRASSKVQSFFECLSRLGEHLHSSPAMKLIIHEIFVSRQNGFPTPTSQHSSNRSLHILLNAYFLTDRNSEHQRRLAMSRLRAFLHDCPNECCPSLFDTLIDKFKDLSQPISPRKRSAESTSETVSEKNTRL